MYKLKCIKCGHTWMHKFKHTRCCPNCKSTSYAHKFQKEFLNELHSNLYVRKKMSDTRKELVKYGIWKSPTQGFSRPKYIKLQHSKRMKKLYKSGKLIPHNKGKRAEDYEPLQRAGNKVSGNLNPAKRLEVRKKISDAAKIRISRNPHKHPNYMQKNVSYGQMELFILLKKIFITKCVLEFPIKTNYGYRYADIALPKYKIDFEFDGTYWHNNEENDKRDRELAEVGWRTIRYTAPIVKALRLELGIRKTYFSKRGLSYDSLC